MYVVPDPLTEAKRGFLLGKNHLQGRPQDDPYNCSSESQELGRGCFMERILLKVVLRTTTIDILNLLAAPRVNNNM